ncbi:RNA polymerase sigma factor [Effusibacillus consociatus]|uniref:RNA polymerase sigma factor n=1 Tax=Effusibacillus consociatus TaxID=1117041 RepID=A0ABV9PVM5_9BACL
MQNFTERFQEIYSAHFRDIYSYVAYSVGSQSEAEDLTQEVFLKAYRALGSFRGDAEVRTWLYAIARNTLRSYFTRKKPAAAGEEELASLASPDSSPEQVVTDRERLGLLQKALLQLNETQRTVVILRNIHGYSTREAAQILNCTETNIKVQLFRALRKLRKILEVDPSFVLERTVASEEVRPL